MFPVNSIPYGPVQIFGHADNVLHQQNYIVSESAILMNRFSQKRTAEHSLQITGNDILQPAL